ncbi:hypothetical protein SLS62_000482 [Diatrype stigma]|uniref:Protein kinase domain-containing protein n=1 Tax=Diatrype stigma TaxID=117547 RepID=A0AAN9V1R5_9PEZI
MATPPAPGSFVQLGGGNSRRRGVNAVIEELRVHFSSQPRFTFEGLLGRGAYGLTCRVVENLGGNAHRKLAVKRAADAAHHADLRNEMRYLRVSVVMVGIKGGPFPEHAFAPVLKFIDFGMAKEGAIGLSENLRKAAMVMMTLITRQANWSQRRVVYQGIDTSAAEILPAPLGHFGTRYATLDAELRDLLARCLAWQVRDRPSLAAMLRAAEAGARKGAAAYGQGSPRETDPFIAAVLRRMIYDGETEPGDASFDQVVFGQINRANAAIQRDDG